MCGIAYISRLTPKNVDLFMLMCYDMQERGEDSFGLTNGFDTYRWVKPFSCVWQEVKGILDLWNRSGYTGYSVLAHTRAASVGEVTLENSHPFRMVDPEDPARVVTGVHNGSISNYSALNAKYNRDFAVDSQQIFAHIAECKPTDELYGYGTVVWYETIEKPNGEVTKFDYFVTFNGGQVAVARFKEDDNHIIVLASTQDAVVKACSTQVDVEFKLYSTKPEHQYEIKDGVLLDNGPMEFGNRVVSYKYTEGRSTYQSPTHQSAYSSSTHPSQYVHSGNYGHSSGFISKPQRLVDGNCLICTKSLKELVGAKSDDVVCQGCIENAVASLPLVRVED